MIWLISYFPQGATSEPITVKVLHSYGHSKMQMETILKDKMGAGSDHRLYIPHPGEYIIYALILATVNVNTCTDFLLSSTAVAE